MKLTLAFEPDRTSLQKIWLWASQNIAKNIVLDLDYDSQLIAGAVITWNGKYRDASYLPKYVSEFTASYGQLQEILRGNI